MWKNEDETLPHLLKMKIAFRKMLKTEDLKSPVKDAKKMKTMSCAGSPLHCGRELLLVINVIMLINRKPAW